MAHVLLTGGTGFVGGHLAEALIQRGAAVRCLVRPGSPTPLLDRLDVELVRGELDDEAAVSRALRGIETVFHVAGAVAERRRGQLHHVNAELTEQFAKACARIESPPTFIHVSSVAAAGPTRRGAVRQVADPPVPISQYGRSKWEGEKRVATLAKQMPVTVIRPGAVFGERDRATASIFKTIRYWRLHPVLGIRTPALAVIHVAELVEVLIRAADRGRRVPADPQDRTATSGVYFACLEQYPTYLELGAMIRRALGYSWMIPCFIPKPLGWVIAAINQPLARRGLGIPLLNLDKLREATAPSWACSPAETFRDLDFAPPVSFEARLRQTAAWYREAGWL